MICEFFGHDFFQVFGLSLLSSQFSVMLIYSPFFFVICFLF